MGYLAVLAGSFVVVLVGVAIVLATLSNALFGQVGGWELIAALVVAAFAANSAARYYEDMNCAPRR
jgi:hypothetical protein